LNRDSIFSTSVCIVSSCV